jgi:hypothetical protein
MSVSISAAIVTVMVTMYRLSQISQTIRISQMTLTLESSPAVMGQWCLDLQDMRLGYTTAVVWHHHLVVSHAATLS